MNPKSLFLIAFISLSATFSMAQVTDKGMTHDFHKQNVGKIAFSKTEILKSTTTADAFTNSFELGDDIYGRVYLAKSLTNELAAIGGGSNTEAFRYRITADGKSLTSAFFDGNMILNSDKEFYDTWTTFQLALSPGDTTGYPSREFKAFFAAIWELSNGTHKMKIELVAKSSSKESVVASGEFNLNVTEAGKTTTGNKMCPYIWWKDGDASLLPEAPGLVEKTKSSSQTVVKVIITDYNWLTRKDKYGNINARWVRGEAIYQDVKTKLYYNVEGVFVQETTNGGSSYGATTWSPDGAMTYKSVYMQSCVK